MAGEDDVTELELVGYTADMQHLVLSDPDRRGSRWYVPIDEDFLNTVEELVQDDPRPGEREDDPEWSDGQTPEPGTGPLAAVAAAASERGLAGGYDGERPARSAQQSRLSPRQIQALLRAGKSPKTVAKQAEADEAWVRRWLPPIESERSQVLQAVWTSSVTKSRLGRSHDLVGEAVRKNLSTKGVDPDSDVVTWSVTRKEGATAWTVTLRYRSRGSTQRAVWRFDPERHLLEPRNQLAVDIAWTRPRQAEQALGAKQATPGKSTPDSKSASRKSASKKTAGKKAAGKKTAGKKTAGKKTAGKKTAGKKTASTEAAGKKTAGKKTAGKKTASTEAESPKKTTARKTTAKKSGGSQSATKKSQTKKAPEPEAAGKKTAGKKTAGKKTASTEAAGKKTAGKKAAGKKTAGKKAAGKKAAGKKAEETPAGAKRAARRGTTNQDPGNGQQEGTSSAQTRASPASDTESSERRRRG